MCIFSAERKSPLQDKMLESKLSNLQPILENHSSWKHNKESRVNRICEVFYTYIFIKDAFLLSQALWKEMVYLFWYKVALKTLNDTDFWFLYKHCLYW